MEEEPKQVSLPIYFFPKCLFMLVVFAAIIIFSSCQAQTNNEPRSSGDNTMTAEIRNISNFSNVHFDWYPTKGTYPQINIDDINYDGEYEAQKNIVSGNRQQQFAANTTFITSRK